MDHGEIDLSCPVNWDHSINAGKVAWWLTIPEPGWWGGLTWRDLCGASGRAPHNGTLTGMTLPSANSGWRGPGTRPGGSGCVQFDGTNDQVDCGAVLSGSYTNLTICGWISKVTSGLIATFGWGDTNNNRCNVLWYADGNAYFQVENGGLAYGNAALSGVGPYHVTLVFDGSLAGNARVVGYVNGRPVSLSYNGTPPATYTATGNFRIGWETANTRGTTGWHDRTAVLTRSLTPAEVWAEFDQSRRDRPDTLNWLSGPETALYPTAGGGGVVAKVPPHVFQSYPVGAF